MRHSSGSKSIFLTSMVPLFEYLDQWNIMRRCSTITPCKLEFQLYSVSHWMDSHVLRHSESTYWLVMRIGLEEITHWPIAIGNVSSSLRELQSFSATHLHITLKERFALWITRREGPIPIFSLTITMQIIMRESRNVNFNNHLLVYCNVSCISPGLCKYWRKFCKESCTRCENL